MDALKSLRMSQVLDKMKQIEKDIPINEVNDVHHEWVARWIKLKSWLELYKK